MKSSELAVEVQQVVLDAQARIMGIGKEQYEEGDQQKFETMPLDGLLDYFVEELLDQINYSVMNIIRVRRLQNHLLRRFREEAAYDTRSIPSRQEVEAPHKPKEQEVDWAAIILPGGGNPGRIAIGDQEFIVKQMNVAGMGYFPR